MKLNLTAKHLENPFVTEWLLYKLDRLKKIDAEKAEDLETIFNDISISKLLEQNDSDVLIPLFRIVSSQRFAKVCPTLCQMWPSWRDTVACWSALIIAQLDPDKFLSLLESSRYSDFNQFFGVLMGLKHLAPKRGKEQFETLLASATDTQDDFLFSFINTECIPIAYKFKLSKWYDLFISAFNRSWKDKKRLKSLVHSTYREISNNQPYLEHIWDLREKHTELQFRDLSLFFVDNAPLSDFDTIISQSGPTSFDKINNLLNYFDSDNLKVPEIPNLIEYAESIKEEFKTQLLGDFIISLLLSELSKDFTDLTDMDLELTISTAAIDLRKLPNYDLILSRFREAPKEDMVPKMIKALDKTREEMGSVHLTSLMGDLKYEEFCEVLIQSISTESHDFLCESATHALTKLGQISETLIIDKWDKLDSSQQIYCAAVLEDIGGEETVEFLLRQAGEKSNVTEDWYAIATKIPDKRLIQVIEPVLDRKQHVIDRAYLMNCLLLDIQTPELKKVQMRETERRKESKKKREAFKKGNIKELIEDTVQLKMRCKNCGSDNYYKVGNIFLDPNQKDNNIFVADELLCVSCGEFADFDLTSEATIALVAEMVKLTMAKEQGIKSTGPFQIVSFQIKGKKTVSAKEAFEYYKNLVAENPNNVKNLIGFANVCKNLGKNRKSIELYTRSLELDAMCADAVYILPQLLQEEGRNSDAVKVIEKAIDNRSHWNYYLFSEASKKEFNEQLTDLYNNLQSDLGLKNRVMPSYGMSDKKKIGRNDPCPCGSGKKYKRCCMNKE